MMPKFQAFAFVVIATAIASIASADNLAHPLENELVCYLPTGGEISPTLHLKSIANKRSIHSKAILADPYPQYLKNPTDSAGTKIKVEDHIMYSRNGEKIVRLVVSDSKKLNDSGLFANIREKACLVEGEEAVTYPFTMSVNGYDTRTCCRPVQ
jgi:hypothetical protein